MSEGTRWQDEQEKEKRSAERAAFHSWSRSCAKSSSMNESLYSHQTEGNERERMRATLFLALKVTNHVSILRASYFLRRSDFLFETILLSLSLSLSLSLFLALFARCAQHRDVALPCEFSRARIIVAREDCRPGYEARAKQIEVFHRRTCPWSMVAHREPVFLRFDSASPRADGRDTIRSCFLTS